MCWRGADSGSRDGDEAFIRGDHKTWHETSEISLDRSEFQDERPRRILEIEIAQASEVRAEFSFSTSVF